MRTHMSNFWQSIDVASSVVIGLSGAQTTCDGVRILGSLSWIKSRSGSTGPQSVILIALKRVQRSIYPGHERCEEQTQDCKDNNASVPVTVRGYGHLHVQ